MDWRDIWSLARISCMPVDVKWIYESLDIYITKDCTSYYWYFFFIWFIDNDYSITVCQTYTGVQPVLPEYHFLPFLFWREMILGEIWLHTSSMFVSYFIITQFYT